MDMVLATRIRRVERLASPEACEGALKSENHCRWVYEMPHEAMSKELRMMLETWRLPEVDEKISSANIGASGLGPSAGKKYSRRKLAVARAWTFATCGAAACYDGSGQEENIMSLFQKREPEVPKKSELSLAIAEKLATGSVMSLGYTQLVEVCRTRYVRGDAIEAQFSVQSPLHNFAFWADLLPSVKSKGPGQMYCSVSDQTADFRAKAERDAGSTTEDRSKSPKTEAHSYLFRESALLPCMFQDCLSLEEQAGLPVRCQETERPNMDLVCGYKSGSTSIKCDWRPADLPG